MRLGDNGIKTVGMYTYCKKAQSSSSPVSFCGCGARYSGRLKQESCCLRGEGIEVRQTTRGLTMSEVFRCNMNAIDAVKNGFTV